MEVSLRVVDDLICDPAEFAPDRAEFNLSENGISVVEANWGESAVEAAMARQQFGSAVVDRHLPDKEASLKLRVGQDGEVDLPTAALQFQQKIGTWQERGGWLQRDFIYGNFAGSLACQVKRVTFSDFGGWQRGSSPDVNVGLLLGPLWYATEEIESEIFTETTERELIFELAEILGTAPGLIRVRVTNDNESGDWRACTLAAESWDHPQDATKDTTAALAYNAADLTPKGGAEVKTVEGLEIVEHADLTAGWLTILNSGHMTHRGVRRLKVRAEDPGSPPDPPAEPYNIQLHVRWRPLGSLAWSEENPIVPVGVFEQFQEFDLGECRPEQAALGDERWEWEVQARAVSGSGAVRLHRARLYPAEQYVGVSAPDTSAQSADLQSQKTPGTVESLDLEGSGEAPWASLESAKASDDSRATVNLSGANDSVSEYLIARNLGFALPEGARLAAPYLVIEVERSSESKWGAAGQCTDAGLVLIKDGAVASTSIGGSAAVWPTSEATATYTVPADVIAKAGIDAAILNESDFGVGLAVYAQAEATAKVDVIRVTAYYTLAADENRVCFAGRELEFRSNGIYRQHPTDEVWGRVIPSNGSFYPHALPSGLEGRATRFMVVPSQGDLGAVPDSGPVKAKAQVLYRPAYHLAREAAAA